MPSSTARHRASRILLGFVAGVLALGLAASFFVEFRYSGRIHSVAEAPLAPVALVFGAGLAPGRSVSVVLAQRLDAAAALLRDGKVEQLLLSGDNSDRYHDEPGAMLRYLTAKGVATSQIRSDPLGLSTYDTCYRAQALFGVKRVLLVTQDFHLPRALFIANALGMDAEGVAADDPKSLHGLYELRELVSRAWALLTVLARPEPQSLAPR